MEKPTIMGLLAQITEETNELKKLMETQITPNKIWVPNVGIVTLWEAN
jgi:hypothetical protein